jgi:hypothetical protein
VRANNAGAAVLIANDLIGETGCTSAVTFGTNTVIYTITPSAGSPVYLWDIQLVSSDSMIGNFAT